MPKTLPLPLRERLRQNEPLSRHTTLRIGGPADLFLAVENEEELIAAVCWAREQSLPCLLLGGGSNVLVADEGVRGLVVANRAHGWRQREAISYQLSGIGHPASCILHLASCILHLASCVPLSRLARATIGQGLAGLEWAVGIPGTVGGAIVGNAGAHGGCMADSLIAVRVLDDDGEVRELAAEELGLGYRSSVFKGQGLGDRGKGIILSAEIALQPGERQELEARAAAYLAQRRRTQPKGLSAGSVFRNPPGDFAGRLIEAAGLKGACHGGAVIAEKHANFIINRGGATAADVLALMALARQRVLERFGVTLELEIELVGNGPLPIQANA
ncbi:MAG: UDP-N-acetylmuramate dehydrogenase [Chloroflexi bacterium]|nr:UDP-N-acetylmuramate dehydrogenase [Chloroflexota bacterium]